MTYGNSLLDDTTITFVGGGAMGSAMISGLLNKTLLKADRLIVADPDVEKGEQLAKKYGGLKHMTVNEEAVEEADIVVLAVKPQVLPHVLPELRHSLKRDSLIVSIVAGVTMESVRSGLDTDYVVRSIPNTPAQIGRGMTVWTATPQVTDEQKSQADTLLSALGETLYVEEEKYLDMATALSGSGPGFVFLFLEALVDVGVHMGFSRGQAEMLALQTVRGAAEYAIASGTHLSVLRNQVTSPGGTTAEGLYWMEKGGLRNAIAEGVLAAYRRSAALGGDADDD